MQYARDNAVSQTENPQIATRVLENGTKVNIYFGDILVPATLNDSKAAKALPKGGTAMFALLAMAGDLGGSIGPAIVGRVTQNTGNNIRAGMGIGLIFPTALLIMLFIFSRTKKQKLH